MTEVPPADETFAVDRDVWPDVLPTELEFPHGRRPPHEHMRLHAADRPDAPAISYYGRTLTWGELDNAVDAFASAMVDRGYEEGVCGLFLQNCPQFIIAYHGANRAGMAVTPVNPQFKRPAAARQLGDSEADAVVAHTGLAEIARQAASEAGGTEVILTEYRAFAGEESPTPLPDAVRDEPAYADVTTDGERRFEAVLSEPPAVTLPDVELSDTALLQYTGGTTGLPKGCVHTHWNVLYKGITTIAVRMLGPEEVSLATMPMFHVAGKQRYCDALAMAGNHAVLLTRYEPEAVMAAVDHHEVTTTWLAVPSAQEIVNHPDVNEYDLTSLSARRDVINCASFGQNLTRELSDEWEALTGTYLQESGYGLTETHTTDTHTTGERRIEPGFVGQPCYGVEVQIRDFETNEVLRPGEEGEIILRTPATMKQYLGRPEATEEVLEDDGFLHTGDVGRQTEEGYLYFLGRRKDTIKVSGHTVSPREVELVLLEYHGIDDAIVVGAPDERRGAVLEAHIVPEDGVDPETVETELLDHAEENLAEYKVPKRVEIRKSFPRTDVGKVDRVAYCETLPDDYE